MKVKNLKAAEYNPRQITERELRDLGRSMDTFGDLGGIVYNRRSGRLVGGHQRVKHLPAFAEIHVEELDSPTDSGTVAEGYVELPNGDRWAYREVDVDEPTELAMNLAANKHGGSWDIPKLADVLAELEGQGFDDLEITGFQEEEIVALLANDGMQGGGEEGEGGGTGDGTPGLGNPVIQYAIIFDDEDQQTVWFRFLRQLKADMPDVPTLGARLEAFITEHMEDGEG